MRKPPKAVIVDYGMGNIFSIQRVINYLGADTQISDNPDVIGVAERLILPGVGAFGDGMDNIKKRGILDALYKFASSDRPLLGICLGMQLLMSESEEFGRHKGLGLIKGKVKKITADGSYKIPHVGWNSIFEKSNWQGTIFEGLKDGDFVYFVHSFAAVPDSTEEIFSETEYAGRRFCSAVKKGNLFGCQFHPEMSATVGQKILKNFLFRS